MRNNTLRNRMKAVILTAALIGSTLIGTIPAYAEPEAVTYASQNGTAEGSIEIQQYFTVAEHTGPSKPTLKGIYRLSGAPEFSLESKELINTVDIDTCIGKLNYKFSHAGVYKANLSVTGALSIPDSFGNAAFLEGYVITAYVKNGTDGLVTDIVIENPETGTKISKLCFSVCADDPPIHKEIQGTDNDTEFTFVMKRKNSESPLPDGSDDEKTITGGKGDHEFGWIYFTEPGEHVYEMSEVNDNKANYTYDTKVYTKTIKITDNNNDGKLEISSTYDQGGAANFVNVYNSPGGGSPSGGNGPGGSDRRRTVTPTPTTPTTPGEVLGATRDAAEDAGRGVLGAVRNPQGQVLGAVRTGDSSAMVTWAVILMLAASGIVGWFSVYQRRKRTI